MTRHLAALALLALACGGGGDAASLQRLLDDDRRAHLETNADLLADHLADSVISVTDGRVEVQSREQVRESFRGYFAGARYHAWEDLVAPVVRIEPGGRSGWVLRQVTVDREAPRLGGATAHRRFTSAWLATYAWRAGRWQMTTVTSTFVPDTPADRILAAAGRATAAAGAEPLDAVRAATDAEGPRGRFQVTVTSRRSGEARIDFSSGLTAGIGPDSNWWSAPGESPTMLDAGRASFLRGHELHMTMLAPASRVPEPAFTGEVDFEGTPALRLSGLDLAGIPIELFFSRIDTLPLGMRGDDRLRGAGPVTTLVSDWVDQNGRRIFRRAEFRQGVEVFRYRYTSVELNPPERSP